MAALKADVWREVRLRWCSVRSQLQKFDAITLGKELPGIIVGFWHLPGLPRTGRTCSPAAHPTAWAHFCALPAANESFIRLYALNLTISKCYRPRKKQAQLVSKFRLSDPVICARQREIFSRKLNCILSFMKEEIICQTLCNIWLIIEDNKKIPTGIKIQEQIPTLNFAHNSHFVRE